MALNANGKIEFNVYDLVIGQVLDNNTQEYVDVVRINPRLGFNPAFVAEMKANGVVQQKPKDE